MKNGCVSGVDYRDEDHPKEYFRREYCRREYGWRVDQGDIDKKNNDGGRDGLRWRVKRMPCPTDTSASSRGGMHPDQNKFLCIETSI